MGKLNAFSSPASANFSTLGPPGAHIIMLG